MSEGTPALRAQTAPRRLADADVRGSSRVFPLTLVAAVGVAAIWLVDISTGPEFGFAIFYLIPIGLASWWLGRGAAVFIATAATLAWISADVISRTSVSVNASVWNGLTRAAIFLMLALLIDQVRRERSALRNVDAHREESLALIAHTLPSRTRCDAPRARSKRPSLISRRLPRSRLRSAARSTSSVVKAGTSSASRTMSSRSVSSRRAGSD
jgi:hypothetical protein